jgi:transcriptional regulator with XRE-family HTH domain
MHASAVPLWASEIIGDSYRPIKLTNVARSSPKQPSDNPVGQYREVVPHSAVPFENHKNSKGMDMSSASVVRKLPSTHERITKAQAAERVAFALQAWGKDRASPIKSLQRLTGVSRKAAEAWWHGRNPPQSDHLFTLARKIPELKAEVRRLLELDQDSAESFQREAIALLQRWAR